MADLEGALLSSLMEEINRTIPEEMIEMPSAEEGETSGRIQGTCNRRVRGTLDG